MKTEEENKRMLALSYMVADLKAENMELEQRVQELVEKYNDVVKQFMELKYRYDEELKTKNRAKK